MATPKVTDMHIIIIVNSDDKFEIDSFKECLIKDKEGVKEVIGILKDTKEAAVYSYLFDKNTWTIEEARNWVKETLKNRVQSSLVMLANKKAFFSSGAQLCSTQPNLKVPREQGIIPLSKESFLAASMNDKYYLYVAGVHEGANKNGTFFSKEELIKSYQTAGFQLIDWEHMRDQVIGFSLEATLRTLADPDSSPEENKEILALEFTGILNRLSPYMQQTDLVDAQSNTYLLRDEIIRQRYFEGKLAVSMECLFDSLECMECGKVFNSETHSMFDYYQHVAIEHRALIDSGITPRHKLIGINFMGWGIVEFPADTKAYVSSLQTNPDNTIRDLIESSIHCPTDIVIEKDKEIVFASEKSLEISTKINTINDNNLSDITGGKVMSLFKFETSITNTLTLVQAFLVANKELVDLTNGQKPTKEQIDAFTTEFSAALARVIGGLEVITLTDRVYNENEVTLVKDVSAQIEAARQEEQSIAKIELTKLQDNLVAAETARTELIKKLEDTEKALTELKSNITKTEVNAKIDTFLASLKEDGVTIPETLLPDVKVMIEAKLFDEKKLNDLKLSLIAMVKQETLATASANNNGLTPGSANEELTGTLEDKLTRIREKHIK
jgi:hypothetical protein